MEFGASITEKDNPAGNPDFWDRIAELYAKTQEYGTLPQSTILYTMTLAQEGKSILEVGWGPGRSCRSFVLTYMKPGTTYTCTDFAPKMIELFEEGFEKSELSKVSTVSLTILDTCEEDVKIPKCWDNDSKAVFTGVVNNETLIFADCSFDKYIASLSLHDVNDYKAMLRESYRVLQDGGRAGFSVWGRLENCGKFNLLPQILISKGYTLPPDWDIGFHLSDDKKLRADLEDTGYKNVKAFYSQFPDTIEDAKVAYGVVGIVFKDLIDSLTDEQKEEIEDEFIKEFNEKYGPDSGSPFTFEILIVYGDK